MINPEIEKKYHDVENSLEKAWEQANAIKIYGDDENTELLGIKNALESLNHTFKQEIENLKKSSEWDKFCIAFFGETNAGKSTIIESLRIIYDEETRRAAALSQKKHYCEALEKHCEDYQKLISALEEINARLSNPPKKYTELFYSIAGAVGIIIGLLLANFGVIVW